MRVYKLLFYPSNKTADIFYDKVSHILFQKDFVRIILKIILVNSVLLVVDLIIQQHMILDIMIAQLRINFRSDPLEEIIEISNCYIYTWDKTFYWYMTCAVILWKLYSGNPQKWTDHFWRKSLGVPSFKTVSYSWDILQGKKISGFYRHKNIHFKISSKLNSRPVFLTHFLPMFLFGTPWKPLSCLVFVVIRGYKKGKLATKKLILNEILTSVKRQCCYFIPPENIRKPKERFSVIFRGYRIRTLDGNGLSL